MTSFRRSALPLFSVCALVSLSLASTSSARSVVVFEGAQDVQQTVPGTGAAVASATLTQCVTAGTESERSLTFAGQMTLIPGSSRMQMRTYLVQRRSSDAQFHMISAPGLGSWVEAQQGVKTYKDLRQVTNLAAPAVYRAVLNFRWLNAHGHVIRRMQLNTPRCVQPAAPAASSGPSSPGDGASSPAGS